jgi:cell division protein FtsQ
VKRKTVLKQQHVKRKNGSPYSELWRKTRHVGSWCLKISALLTGLAAISVLFVVLYSYLLTSPYIRLEQVEIVGVDEGMKKELQRMSGLNFDLSLLAINVDEVQKKLEKHPWVRAVEVEKQFPHALLIRVEKEEPRAIVVAGKLYYMNRFGKVFKEVGPNEPVDFPMITGGSSDELGRQKQLGFSMQVLQFLESQSDPWSLKNLSEIHVKKDGDVCLYFSFLPAAVKLRAQNLECKMAELKRVVEHLNSTGRIHTVKAINLEYSEGAVVSFKKG